MVNPVSASNSLDYSQQVSQPTKRQQGAQTGKPTSTTGQTQASNASAPPTTGSSTAVHKAPESPQPSQQHKSATTYSSIDIRA